MWIEVGLILTGIVMLYYGGDLLIAGCIHIAHNFKITPFIIGATIIGFGTSAPELAVSVFASLKEASSVALGNAIGSNITNICLVLGLTVLLRAILVSKKTFNTETPPLLFATTLIAIMAWDHEISRTEGVILLLLTVGYVFRTFKKNGAKEAGNAEEKTLRFTNFGISVQLLILFSGLLILVTGAHLLVTGAVSIARSYGISEWLIGITIVAIGTSLPEIVTSLMASLRGHHEMSIGNIYGSNIFNIGLVVGTASIINPLYIREAIHPDLVISTLITFLLVFLIKVKYLITPHHGVILIGCYISYIMAKSFQIF